LGAFAPAILCNYIDIPTKFWVVPWFGVVGFFLTYVFLPDMTGLDLKEQGRSSELEELKNTTVWLFTPAILSERRCRTLPWVVNLPSPSPERYAVALVQNTKFFGSSINMDNSQDLANSSLNVLPPHSFKLFLLMFVLFACLLHSYYSIHSFQSPTCRFVLWIFW